MNFVRSINLGGFLMFGNILWLRLKNGKTIFCVETFHLAKGILFFVNVETSF